MDNAGENVKFVELLTKEGVQVKIEYTPVDGPQYNGVVERAFQTLYGRVRAMLNHGGFFGEIRQKLWAECASTANKLDDILSYKRGVPGIIFDGDRKYVNNLHAFGELAVVTTGGKQKIKAKLTDRGKIFLSGTLKIMPEMLFAW